MSESASVDQAVVSGGTYEVLRSRLLEQGKNLEDRLSELNAARLNEFGQTELEVLGRLRLRTTHNCVARDLVRIGDCVLLGYNVTLGLKKTTQVEDVFALYRAVESNGQYEADPINIKKTFLNESQFLNDFRELYNYYKDTRLTQLVVKQGKLLAAFQIGDRLSDQRVFRWALTSSGEVEQYIDNRGERDIAMPEKFDFEWQTSSRDDVEDGRNPHYNILDTVFIDCQRGDLTVKIENNTNTGRGIYSEPVNEPNQSLDDCAVSYAQIGQLLLLKITPYQEDESRYLVFNAMLEQVVRIDSIGQSCVQLPEDHGIIYPGGYYLTNGEFKTYDDDMSGMTFKRMFRSPNGEDVMFVFYEPHQGKVSLFNYNLIDKALQNPMLGHGYGFFDDGRLALFYAENEATRVHPLQIWQTPFVSDEFANAQPPSQTFYGRIGNPDLVRGIADLYGVVKTAQKSEVSAAHFNQLSKDCYRMFDAYHWLDNTELETLAPLIRKVAETSELVLDEFEKVVAIRSQSDKAIGDAEATVSELMAKISGTNWQQPQDFVTALSSIRKNRGHLITLREYRYIDLEKIDELDALLAKKEAHTGEKTLQFLAQGTAFSGYSGEFERIGNAAPECKTVAGLKPFLGELETLAEGLDLLSELMATLKVDDPTIQTQIVDQISTVYSQLNQRKARIKQLMSAMGSDEAKAQFGARFKLLSQSVNNALSMASTPEKADEQLTRLLVQLEELESQFSEHDDFLGDILSKREEIFETFEGHKQTLLEARQRRSQNLHSAAERILASIARRTRTLKDSDQLNTFFASDALIQKIQTLAAELRALDDVIRADDIEAKLKAQKDQAIRTLRDQSELFEGDGNVIRLGPKHKFSVNTQSLDITLLERDGQQVLHLTGTDYYQLLKDSPLNDYRDLWHTHLPSENAEVYRGEYLAYLVLDAAQKSEQELTWRVLTDAVKQNEALLELVRKFSSARYKDAYQKGIHDQDACSLLQQLVPKMEQADSFAYTANNRSLAISFWCSLTKNAQDTLVSQAKTAGMQRKALSSLTVWQELSSKLTTNINAFVEAEQLTLAGESIETSADYLIFELANNGANFAISQYSGDLIEQFNTRLATEKHKEDFNKTLTLLDGRLNDQRLVVSGWLNAFVSEKEDRQAMAGFVPEAVACIVHGDVIETRHLPVDLVFSVEGLFGEHTLISQGSMTIVLDEYLARLSQFTEQVVPRWLQLQSIRQQLIEQYRDELRLDQYQAKPLASFVRNKLITEVYLPLIGDNLAKQMGTVGDSKRTDLMGLLLMISPPGYGKTTLMEYVANRLGLVFMKINCPSIGHDITSIDPETATNSAARQELEKLNLGLEMGNNVMLYLDDIQHTNPEFLQKFISLCDGTRRIEGVWKGKSKTYDMRGKKFCVVMAGNPYTESGELFKIPDMLANRADIYNLGDELSGKEDVFALSYLENSLTSNSILAGLATRPLDDFYKLVDMTQRGTMSANDLSHPYSGAELKEISQVLKRMFAIQEVVLAVNRQYISSAATADQYRQEPPFKLQGSYRNMNKMAEKINAVMSDDEMHRMIGDHYSGEAQLLTSGAEENILKLAQLRDVQTGEETVRWQQMLDSFKKTQAMGGQGSDTGMKVVSQLVDLVASVRAFQENTDSKQDSSEEKSTFVAIEKLAKVISENSFQNTPEVNVVNQPVPGIEKLLVTLADTFENSLIPLAKIMDGKINIDLKNLETMRKIQSDLKELAQSGDLSDKP